MADWADDEAGRIWRQRQAFADRAELESVLATALRKARADGMREAAEIAASEELGSDTMLSGTGLWAVHDGACITIKNACRNRADEIERAAAVATVPPE